MTLKRLARVVVVTATLCAGVSGCGSDDPDTQSTDTALVIASVHVVESIPAGAIVVSPEQFASISYFTGINAADEQSLRRAMCPAQFPDGTISAWSKFLRSQRTWKRLEDGRAATGDVHYPLVDGVEVEVTLTMESLPDGQRCVRDVAVAESYRGLFLPPTT
jgi:hypothetical protein